MADDGSVTDGEMMTGFKSLQRAMALGFERQNAEFHSMIDSVVQSEIALVRADRSALEHRMRRRFDKVDERFHRIEDHVGLGRA
jgi:hypothetical protein